MKLIAGFFFAALAASLAHGQTSFPSGSVLSASGGRYVLGQISSSRADQFLLDTQTGKVWQIACATPNKLDSFKCDEVAMRPVAFLSDQAALPAK